MANSFKKFTIQRLIEPYARQYVGLGSEENYNAFFNPTGTTVDLADVDADINTTDKYLGKPAYDSTLGEPVWASGPDPGDAWVQASGTGGGGGAFTLEPTNNIVSVGAGAALTASAADNFLAGRLAGNILTSGDGNVVIGRFTGNGLTTGDDNICIGQNAGPTIGSTSDKLFVGQGAGTGSPLLYGHTGATGKFLNVNGALTVNDEFLTVSGATTATFQLVSGNVSSRQTMNFMDGANVDAVVSNSTPGQVLDLWHYAPNNIDQASAIQIGSQAGDFRGFLRFFAGGSTGVPALECLTIEGSVAASSDEADFTYRVLTSASTTARAGLALTHGAAPTTPADGDMWTTTAGLFVRINGVTVGPLS